MTFFQWRRFNFFDVQRDVDKGGLFAILQVGDGLEFLSIISVKIEMGVFIRLERLHYLEASLNVLPF